MSQSTHTHTNINLAEVKKIIASSKNHFILNLGLENIVIGTLIIKDSNFVVILFP